MRRLSTFVALVLLLSGSSPILACMTGESMSATESACCRSMHGNCGDMAKTGCCRVEAKSGVQSQIATSAPSVDAPALIAVPVWLTVQPAFTTGPPVNTLKIPDEHPPPGLILVRISNLRI